MALYFDKQSLLHHFSPLPFSFILKTRLVVSRGDVISMCIKPKSQVSWKKGGEKHNHIILFSFKHSLGPYFSKCVLEASNLHPLGLLEMQNVRSTQTAWIRAFEQGLQVIPSVY